MHRYDAESFEILGLFLMLDNEETPSAAVGAAIVLLIEDESCYYMTVGVSIAGEVLFVVGMCSGSTVWGLAGVYFGVEDLLLVDFEELVADVGSSP